MTKEQQRKGGDLSSPETYSVADLNRWTERGNQPPLDARERMRKWADHPEDPAPIADDVVAAWVAQLPRPSPEQQEAILKELYAAAEGALGIKPETIAELVASSAAHKLPAFGPDVAPGPKRSRRRRRAP